MATAIIRRKDALAQGLTRYFTGKPCKNRHIEERLVSTGVCYACARNECKQRYWRAPQESRERVRKYRAENPETVKAGTQRYRQEHPNLEKEWRRRRRERDPEKVRQAERVQSKRWKAANPERMRAHRLKWLEANWERRIETIKRWRIENPEKSRAITRNRRARLLNCEGSHTADEVKAILKAQGQCCAYCQLDLRKAKRHADHIVPLSKGGSNWASNIQVLCVSCNVRKNAKDPIAFAQQMGRLL